MFISLKPLIAYIFMKKNKFLAYIYVNWKKVLGIGIATLILASANLGVGGYIGYAGGHVRHKEFRFEPAPDPEEAEHHHHDGAPDEHTKAEPSKPMDHGSMPGMDMSKSPESKEPPIPTDEQLEASRMQLKASRLQLEASRKQLEATDAAKTQGASPAPSLSPASSQEHKHDH